MNQSLKQTLKAKAHHLKPVILFGAKGLTPAIVQETDIALLTHELIKVKLSGTDKASRSLIAQELCQQLKAELIQILGTTAIIYRKKED